MAFKRISLPVFLVKNRGIKLASFLLALITWYAIQPVINYESVVSDIPISIELDEGWAILDRSAKTVDVLFRGSQEDVRYLSPDQVNLDVDLRGETFEGSLTVRLRPQNVKAPSSVRPIVIHPDEVKLVLDREGEIHVPVKADLQGSPPEGYEVEKVACTPASVKLSGPRERLGQVEAMRTAPIDVEGRSRSFKKLKVALVQPSDTWVARVSPDSVSVEVTFVERAATREMKDIPVEVLVKPGTQPKVDLRPGRVTIVVKGRSELLNELQPQDLTAYIDSVSLQAGASYDLPVRVQMPSGLSVAGVEPPSINVVIEEM